MEIYNFIYDKGRSTRLDIYLAENIADYSRSFFQKLIDSGNVKVNGQVVKSGYKLAENDKIDVNIVAVISEKVIPVEMPLDIVFEDEHILVINKPSGMTVHPAAGHKDDTLVNAILAHCEHLSTLGGDERPGIVHRLDKNTSGLLVAAKTDIAHKSLQEQIQNRTMSRKYKALVIGNPDFEQAKIDMPIGRHPTNRQKQAVIEETDRYHSRNAVTHIKVLARYKYFTLLEAGLETGRTHQIRVHLSYIKYPVLGDVEYGGVKRNLPFACSKTEEKEYNELLNNLHGQMLHAYKLSFTHPTTGELLEFEQEEPIEFKEMIAWLADRF